LLVIACIVTLVVAIGTAFAWHGIQLQQSGWRGAPVAEESPMNSALIGAAALNIRRRRRL
jgi:hypothetical protein